MATGEIDKRRSPRYAIKLNALVHPNKGRSWVCSIHDFCDSGMLLTEPDSTRVRRAMPGIKPREEVGIHFSVPGGKKDQHFRLEGIIVRAMDSGVGINFPSGMDSDAMGALMAHSGGSPAQPTPKAAATQGSGAESGAANSNLGLAKSEKSSKAPFLTGGIRPEDSKRMVAALRKEILKVMPEMNTALFKYMDSELLELAKNAKSNAEQSEYFAAMSNLEKAKKQVGHDFMQEVVDQLDSPRDLETLLEERRKANEERKAASASKRVKLSLVNTEEFEDWLAVANIISRSERSYEKYLDELLIRMGHMVDAWSHNEANPLGLSVFCHAFDDSIGKVELTKEIRQKVYTGYESTVIPLFRKLYIASTKLLEESGLFPDIDDDYVAPAKPVTAPPGQTETQEEIEEEEEEEEVEEEPEVEDEQEIDDLEGELRDELRRRREGRRQDRGREPTRRRARGRPVPNRKPARDVSEAISNIYGTVRELMHDDYDDDEDADYVELDEVDNLLQQLQSEMLAPGGRQSGSRMPIRQQLMENAAVDGRQRRLAPQAAQSIDVVESLVDTIEEDEFLPEGVKDWVRQLELTLGKVATRQTDFLSDANPHKSVEVINQLARLSGAETGSVKRNVDEIIENINQGFDSDPEVFDQAYEKLQPLVERQNRAFTGNVQRVVKASEGQQTLQSAQKAVVSELDQRLSGKEIPEVLMKLLMPGWRNLMVNTHLRQGAGSSDWHRHVQAMEQVFEHLDEDADPTQSESYMPPEEILEHIESGLESISYEPGQRGQLIDSLRHILTDEDAARRMPKVSIDSVAETLGLTDVEEKDVARQKILEEKANDTHWSKHLERAKLLHVGEWVEFGVGGNEAEIGIVAWMADDSAHVTFVNRRGAKLHDLSTEELATMFADGEARILEESDIPLTDRASHRMLQNMHNKLTHQATHDELTGLVNRKEFERELERALGPAQK